MALKKAKTPVKKNINKPAAAPVKPKAVPRELTRAEKTAMARAAAAVRRRAETATAVPASRSAVRKPGNASAGSEASKRDTAQKTPKSAPKTSTVPKRTKVVSKAKTNVKPKTAPKRGAPAPKAKPLTRSQMVWAAREAAAKRNAQRITSAPSARPSAEAASRSDRVRAAREAAAKRNADVARKRQADGLRSNVNGSAAQGADNSKRRTVNARASIKKARQAEARREINRKTNLQTPKNRKEARKDKKVSGSVKNIEIRPHTRDVNHSFRVKKKRQALGKLLLARLVLFFIIFAIMFSLVAGVFALSLRSGRAAGSKEYTLQLGLDIPEDSEEEVAEEDKPVYVEIPKSCAVRYGNLYIPVSALSDMCELTVTGTVSDLRYLPRQSEGHSMRFIVGSDIAYVNGAKVRMISPSFIYSGKLYVPLDFLQKYSKGLSIETDEGNRKITVSKILEGYDASNDRDIYSTLTFNLSATSPLTAIEEPVE